MFAALQSRLLIVFWPLVFGIPTLAIFGWGKPDVEATLVFTIPSSINGEPKPDVLVISQRGSFVYWTATANHFFDEFNPSEPAVYRGTLNVKGIDLAKTFDSVKSIEKNTTTSKRDGKIYPISMLLSAKDRSGLCLQLTEAQRDEFAKESSPLRKVLDHISESGILAKGAAIADITDIPGARRQELIFRDK